MQGPNPSMLAGWRQYRAWSQGVGHDMKASQGCAGPSLEVQTQAWHLGPNLAHRTPSHHLSDLWYLKVEHYSPTPKMVPLYHFQLVAHPVLDDVFGTLLLWTGAWSSHTFLEKINPSQVFLAELSITFMLLGLSRKPYNYHGNMKKAATTQSIDITV